MCLQLVACHRVSLDWKTFCRVGTNVSSSVWLLSLGCVKSFCPLQDSKVVEVYF